MPAPAAFLSAPLAIANTTRVNHLASARHSARAARRPLAPRACAEPSPATPSSSAPASLPPRDDAPATAALPSSNLFAVSVPALSTDPEQNLRGFIKTRGSLVPGEEFVYWFTGEVHGVVDGEGSRHLFGIEGYNIGRMMRVDGGWRMLTREVAVYRAGDRHGPILASWRNDYTGRDDAVVHVWNDPVNQEFREGRFMVGTTIMGAPGSEIDCDSVGSSSSSNSSTSGEDDGFVCWNSDVFPRYESPLPRRLFPDVSSGDIYEAAEMFQLFADRRQLEDGNIPAVRKCSLSWTRIGPWLPWMRMGSRPGRLVYHCRGHKARSFEDLPAGIREFVRAEHPEYAAAPEAFSRPNETSWTYMRKLLDGKGMPRADGRVAPAEADVAATAAAAAAAAGAQAPAPAPQERRKKGEGAQLQTMSTSELRRFDGKDGQAVYVSVMGRVFDVSSARRHYGPGQTYHCLAGREAAPALLSGDLDGLASDDEGRAGTMDLSRLSSEERESIEGWLEFYAGNYDEVAVLDGE